MSKLILILNIFMIASCFGVRSKHSRVPLNPNGGEFSLSIMTFNILASIDLKSKHDGYGSWHQRRSKVFNLIRNKNPQILIVQECTEKQFAHFRDEFSDVYQILQFRNSTPDVIILFKKEFFSILEQGHWNIESVTNFRIPRIAAWVKLHHLDSQSDFMVVGAHFDATMKRIHEIQMVNKELARDYSSGAPMFLAGDFNSSPTEPGYSDILDHGWQESFHKDGGATLYTFPALKPSRQIDHILYRGNRVRVINWSIVFNEAGPPASDHKAVYAEFLIERTQH